MGLFNFGKKWDVEKEQEYRGKMEELFHNAVEDSEGYTLIYVYNMDVSSMSYVVARKTTYTYKSIIFGFRESDMKVAMVDTIPTFDGYGNVREYLPSDIKKAKRKMNGEYIMYPTSKNPDYELFAFAEEYDDESLFPYMKQKENLDRFDLFWKEFTKEVKG